MAKPSIIIGARKSRWLSLSPRQYNFGNWVFCGAEMRAQSVDWFPDRLRNVARIPASDEDDDRLTGLFFVSHEVDGMSEWQVRDGTVLIRTASQEKATEPQFRCKPPLPGPPHISRCGAAPAAPVRMTTSEPNGTAEDADT
jgi:hypothetical protein